MRRAATTPGMPTAVVFGLPIVSSDSSMPSSGARIPMKDPLQPVATTLTRPIVKQASDFRGALMDPCRWPTPCWCEGWRSRRPGGSAMLRGMSTLNFYAPDLAAARRWYTELLGIEPYFEVPGYIEYRIGDDEDERGIIDAAYAPPGSTGGGGATVYWHVDDLDSTLE